MNLTKIERVIAGALPLRLVRRWGRLLAEVDPEVWTVPSWRPGDGSWPDQQLQQMIRKERTANRQPSALPLQKGPSERKLCADLDRLQSASLEQS